MSGATLVTELSPPQASSSRALSPIAQLADIPEEEIWLAKQKSKRTRRAYKLDVQHFMRTLHITSYDELRQVDHRAVIAWERIMREIDQAEPSTVRRRLAALSSLFKHLVRHHHVQNNPVADVERPAINRREGSTLAFSKADAAKLLMHRIYKVGILHEHVAKNPVMHVETRSKSTYRAIIITPAQTVAILKSLPSPLHYTLVLTCAATALRSSEILALRWADMHWHEGRIQISKR